jgi:hypothetical protein
MEKVRRGEMPWTNLDHLHRALLEDLLVEFHIEGLSEEEKDHRNRVRHRLKPWPDSVAGLTRLKKKYTIAPLSNGNVALLADMAKHAGLPWDLMSARSFSLRVRRTTPSRAISTWCPPAWWIWLRNSGCKAKPHRLKSVPPVYCTIGSGMASPSARGSDAA